MNTGLNLEQHSHLPSSVRGSVHFLVDTYALTARTPAEGEFAIRLQFVNRDVAAVVKAHNLIHIRTRPYHPESNGIVERFNGTVRTESDDNYGNDYLQAETIIGRVMHHYHEERSHASLVT